jgi:hypothetical protein
MEQNGLSLGGLREELRRERASLAVLVYVALALAVTEYFLLPGAVFELFPAAAVSLAPGVHYGAWGLAPAGTNAPWWGTLFPWAWWSGGLFVVWVVLPLGLARLQGLHPRDLGLSAGGSAGKWPVYVAMLVLVTPAVLWAAGRESFTTMYPFLRPEYCQVWSWRLLLCFWGLYALQFFSVEFFFRGWMVFSLERRYGMGAVWIMLVPYCAIHFHKPLPETLGSILAGAALGYVALRTRSIWGGWCVHVIVALGMDVLSLARGGRFPQVW